METEGFLDALDFLSQESSSLISQYTPKTQLIKRQTSVNTIKPIFTKRPIDFKYIETECPSKIQKPTKLLRNSF
jgi:hypothetical protein